MGVYPSKYTKKELINTLTDSKFINRINSLPESIKDNGDNYIFYAIYKNRTFKLRCSCWFFYIKDTKTFMPSYI